METYPTSSPDPDILNPLCPSRCVLGVIGAKWSVLIVHVLAGEPMRHGQLRRATGGISQKVLTQTLRALEREGVVSRTIHPGVPPRVDYALTRRGGDLLIPLRALRAWAEEQTLDGTTPPQR